MRLRHLILACQICSVVVILILHSASYRNKLANSVQCLLQSPLWLQGNNAVSTEEVTSHHDPTLNEMDFTISVIKDHNLGLHLPNQPPPYQPLLLIQI